jgi:murein DD-endopeptidase MepM/ murein hydrolase activator NlpD
MFSGFPVLFSMKSNTTTHIVSLLCVTLFLFMGSFSFASAVNFPGFISRVKSTFFPPEKTEQELNSEASKASVLTPSLLSLADEAEDEEVLAVKSGPMRLSTEEIDYPLEDTITVYEVKEGDTISSVARLFRVTVNTILWANDLPNKKIKEGDVIVILPVTGVKYAAKEGETLASIAKKFKGDTSEIAKFNGLSEGAILALGEEIIIPNGEVEAEKKGDGASIKRSVKKLFTTPVGFFVKPLARYVKTQGIHGKNAVDLGGKYGAPVVATASGKVLVARSSGYNGGYGSMVVIAHKNNVQTLYAHLSSVSVQSGMIVEQGQVIGALGNSGRSTGPHLHIEIRGAVNPF